MSDAILTFVSIGAGFAFGIAAIAFFTLWSDGWFDRDDEP